MSGRGLFESLALAQISGHLSPKETICDIDRVTALGFAPRLGSYLIRLKAANDAASYIAAVRMLSSRLYQMGIKNRWGHMARMQRVAQESVRFYLFDMCKTCEGRGKLAHSYSGPQADDDAGETCPTCSGSAKADRNVRGRAAAIYVPGDIPSRLEKILDAADGIVGRSERIATGISRWKLYGNDYGT